MNNGRQNKYFTSNMVVSPRFELGTSSLSGTRSNQLSYETILKMDGATGFEPVNIGIKNRGLTAWRYPNIKEWWRIAGSNR
jgi:hypothetical protein